MKIDPRDEKNTPTNLVEARNALVRAMEDFEIPTVNPVANMPLIRRNHLTETPRTDYSQGLAYVYKKSPLSAKQKKSRNKKRHAKKSRRRNR